MLPRIDRLGFSSRLRGLIDGKGLTQKAAAEALGIPIPQMSRYLNGQVPDPAKLLVIAAWAGTTVEWLLTGHDLLLEITELGNAGKEGKERGAATGQDRVEWKLLEKSWEALDPVSKGKLLRIITLGMEPARHYRLLDYLQIIENLLQMEAHDLNRETRLRKRAAILSDVTLLCMTGLEEKDAEFVANECDRLYHLSIMRSIRGQSQEGLKRSQEATQGAHQAKLEQMIEKRVERVLTKAREKIRPDQLSELSNQLVGIARIFRKSELSSQAGAKKLGRMKTTLTNDLAILPRKQFTPETWTQFVTHVTRLLIAPQKQT